MKCFLKPDAMSGFFKPIYSLKYISNFAFREFTELASTISAGKEFQVLAILLKKKLCLCAQFFHEQFFVCDLLSKTLDPKPPLSLRFLVDNASQYDQFLY